MTNGDSLSMRGDTGSDHRKVLERNVFIVKCAPQQVLIGFFRSEKGRLAGLLDGGAP